MIRVLFLILSLSLVAVAVPVTSAEAQDSGKPAAKGRNKAPPKPANKNKRSTNRGNKSKTAPAAAATPDKAGEPAKASESTPRAPNVDDAAAIAADADERVRKEAGSEIKTVEFGGLDIEGQLKTPQMLYFLNRLRAEFSRPELPHRSFIPELQRGTKESAF